MKKFSVILIMIILGVLVFTLPVLAVNPVSKVLVTITVNADPTKSDVKLDWDAVAPADPVLNRSEYVVSKSVDGGKTYTLVSAANNTSVTQSVYAVANYTNVTLKVVVEERVKVGGALIATSLDKLTNVYPPDSNAHANFTANTNECQQCHQTHVANGEKLLKSATTLGMCQTCHWGTGTNSKYNVKTGATTVASGALTRSLGGPMNLVDSEKSAVWGITKTTTSAHVYDNTLVTAPGGYSATQQLTCTSCHGAHETGNYRQIVSKVVYPSGPSTTSEAIVVFKAAASTQDSTSGEASSYLSGSVSLCAACHGDYNSATGSGHGTKTGTYTQAYRHATGVAPSSFKDTAGNSAPLTTTLPLEGSDVVANNNKLVCLTCHYAHGSIADGTATGVLGNTSTMLKRLDNMGVCEDCHKK